MTKSADSAGPLEATVRSTVDAMLTSLIDRLQARSDNAYCDYINQLRRDECLGWEIKVERGRFGEAELKGHCAAAEKLGRHRALHEAAEMLRQLLTPNAKGVGLAGIIGESHTTDGLGAVVSAPTFVEKK